MSGVLFPKDRSCYIVKHVIFKMEPVTRIGKLDLISTSATEEIVIVV